MRQIIFVGRIRKNGDVNKRKLLQIKLNKLELEVQLKGVGEATKWSGLLNLICICQMNPRATWPKGITESAIKKCWFKSLKYQIFNSLGGWSGNGCGVILSWTKSWLNWKLHCNRVFPRVPELKTNPDKWVADIDNRCERRISITAFSEKWRSEGRRKLWRKYGRDFLRIRRHVVVSTLKF